YGYYPGCPLCKQLDTTTFRDPKIAALVERAVPVAIDLSKLEPEERDRIFERRYPLLEIQDSNGAILHTFAGTFLDVDVKAELDGSLADARPPDWGVVREHALRRLGEAARELLDSARAHANEPGAIDDLEKEARRFAGTSFEPDLEAVLARWRATGRFPEIELTPNATH